jgi:hypothetical protein
MDSWKFCECSVAPVRPSMKTNRPVSPNPSFQPAALGNGPAAAQRVEDLLLALLHLRLAARREQHRCR